MSFTPYSIPSALLLFTSGDTYLGPMKKLVHKLLNSGHSFIETLLPASRNLFESLPEVCIMSRTFYNVDKAPNGFYSKGFMGFFFFFENFLDWVAF